MDFSNLKIDQLANMIGPEVAGQFSHLDAEAVKFNAKIDELQREADEILGLEESYPRESTLTDGRLGDRVGRCSTAHSTLANFIQQAYVAAGDRLSMLEKWHPQIQRAIDSRIQAAEKAEKSSIESLKKLGFSETHCPIPAGSPDEDANRIRWIHLVAATPAISKARRCVGEIEAAAKSLEQYLGAAITVRDQWEARCRSMLQRDWDSAAMAAGM